MTDPTEAPPPDIEIAPHEPPPPPPMEGNGTDTISARVQKAREVIPMGDRGAAPMNYAQWIDIAKDVCRAYLMLPTHLHNNAPVVAGILEIAARFDLSPYMLASKTYVDPKSKRLAFEAQAFAAILYASKLLKGRLNFEFRGEGDLRTCTVSGRFKDDPDTLLMATTPTLNELRPGTVQKDGQTYIKGSQLWRDDPEQQMAYYAERRWIRRFAPDVCMGMYAREEIEELDRYRAETDGAIPLTADRLGHLDTGEGWQEGQHVGRDLAAIASDEDWPAEMVTQDEIEAAESEPAPKPSRPPRQARQKPVERRKPGRPPKMATTAKAAPAAPKRPVGRPRTKPLPPTAVTRAVRRAEQPPRKIVAQPPRWLDYVTKTEAWIEAATDASTANQRWEGELDHRDSLQVPMGERSRLRAILDRKLDKLKPKPEPQS